MTGIHTLPGGHCVQIEMKSTGNSTVLAGQYHALVYTAQKVEIGLS